MDITNIVNELKLERDRINAAIFALDGRSGGRNRRYSKRDTTTGFKPRRRLSAAARKKISVAAKARWARAKRAGRTSL